MNNCLICNKEFIQKPNTSGKYCSLSCGNRSRKGLPQKSSILKKENIIIYMTDPKRCKGCSGILEYNKKDYIFCCNSCSTTFNNKLRDKIVYIKSSATLKRTVARDGNNITNRPKYSKLSFCKMCDKTISHKHVGTCSKECKSQFLSLALRGKTGGSTKQFIKVKDSFGKDVSLDSSWELILSEDLNRNNIKWIRPSAYLLSSGRKYTPDFYLPDYKVFLDPKAYRKGYLLQVEKIKIFEQEFKTKCLIISEKKLLTWAHIKSLLTA